MSRNEAPKCTKKCLTCQNRDKKTNFCLEKGIDCTKTGLDFTKCDSYLVNEKLVHF